MSQRLMLGLGSTWVLLGTLLLLLQLFVVDAVNWWWTGLAVVWLLVGLSYLLGYRRQRRSIAD